MSGPLEGLRVLDAGVMFAGPFAGTIMGDLGAEVIKVEHPRGDPLRYHGYQKDGIGLWWKVAGRNKSTVTLDLSDMRGQDLFRRLAETADVVIESFRPGVMERWNLGFDSLSTANPNLVMLRMSGFGRKGPYSSRPGFGTIAESMSGFAHITGSAEGPPTLPPFGLADGIAGLAGAIPVLSALRWRDNATEHRGGQEIDIAIIEPILSVLGYQITAFDQLGIVQRRLGNRSAQNAPRNVYETSDGRWLALSSSSPSVAKRVMTLVGRPELVPIPTSTTPEERLEHIDAIDATVSQWIKLRSYDEAMSTLIEAEIAVGPIYSVADVVTDPQYQALGTVVTVEDEDLGPLRMQNVMFRFTESPGSVRWAGRRLGQDNATVLGELGLSPEDLAELGRAGVISAEADHA